MSGTAGCIEECRWCSNARKPLVQSDLSTVVDVAGHIRSAFSSEVFDVMVHDTPSATGVDIYGHSFFKQLWMLQVGLSDKEELSRQEKMIWDIIRITQSRTFATMHRIGDRSSEEILQIAQKWVWILEKLIPEGVIWCSFTDNVGGGHRDLRALERMLWCGVWDIWNTREDAMIETSITSNSAALLVQSKRYIVGQTSSVAIRYMQQKVGTDEPPIHVWEDGGGVFITPSGIHFEHDAGFMGKTFLPTQDALRLLSHPRFAWLRWRNSFAKFVQRWLDETARRRKK